MKNDESKHTNGTLIKLLLKRTPPPKKKKINWCQFYMYSHQAKPHAYPVATFVFP